MVKSKKIIILLIILGFVLFFCKKNIPMKKELSKHNGQVIFSLNNTDYKKRPVVTIEDSGVIFYFVVDTGCTQSYVNENFCKKINLSPEEYGNFEGGIVTLCIEDSRYLIDGKEHILKMPVKKIEVFIEKEIDGLLGIDFLSHKSLHISLGTKVRRIRQTGLYGCLQRLSFSCGRFGYNTVCKIITREMLQ